MIRLGYKLKNYPTEIIGFLHLGYFQIEKALTNLHLRSRIKRHTVRYLLVLSHQLTHHTHINVITVVKIVFELRGWEYLM